MAWTKPQIKAAAIAARSADWNDQQLHMVLSSLGGRAVHQGKLTRTSPRLNDDDYEMYMATAEAAPECGGTLPRWNMGYWRAKVIDAIQRQRYTIERLAGELELAPPHLNGMIDKATGGRAKCLDDVDRLNDRATASRVIDLLKAKAKAKTLAPPPRVPRPGPHRTLVEQDIPF